MGRAIRVVSFGALAVALVAQSAELDFMVGELCAAWGLHGAIVCIIGALLLRRLTFKTEAGALLLAACLFAWPWGRAARLPRAPGVPTATLSVATLNTFYENPRSEEIVAALTASEVAIALLVEPPEAMIAVLKADPQWRLLAAHMPGGKWNIALAARTGVELSARITPGELTESAWIEATGRVEERPFSLLGLHVPAPTRFDQHAERLRQLDLITERVRTSTVPIIVLGDFNLPPSSPRSVALHDAGLRRASGLTQGTWPQPLAQLGLRLDYVWAKDFGIKNEEVFDIVESDHRGVRADLGFK